MPKVFAPHIPSRYDSASRLWVPSVEIRPAEKFGDLVVMLQPNSARAGLAPCVAAMKEMMANFSDQDYLIGLGDPSLIGAAACIAVRKTGGLLRMLKWDRMAKDYFVAEVRV